MILALILVFVGGAIGSMCRFWLSGFVAERFGETFPYGTLIVNLVGSWIIGLAAGWIAHFNDPFWASAAKQLLMVGICGGLTTFFSFSLQTLESDAQWQMGKRIYKCPWIDDPVPGIGSGWMGFGPAAFLAQRIQCDVYGASQRRDALTDLYRRRRRI
jgi:CrcB protein